MVISGGRGNRKEDENLKKFIRRKRDRGRVQGIDDNKLDQQGKRRSSGSRDRRIRVDKGRGRRSAA